MKQKYLWSIVILTFLSLTTVFQLSAQSQGDIAFVAFNADGDKDFAIVALADITANTTIYFTDDETTGVGTPSALAGSEGTITWSTGPADIKAGTVVVFTDVDSSSNPNFGASIGSISRSGSFGLSASKDGIIAFLGTDEDTPTTYLAALQIGNDSAFLGPFDGDGITDVAVLRKNEDQFQWIVRDSTKAGTVYRRVIFDSLPLDTLPLLGDFNGDGKGDFAFYLPATFQSFYWNEDTQAWVDQNRGT